MINLQSILSLFDDKPTLLKWLKKVEAALAASVLTSVGVEQVGEDVTLTFNFEDGTSIVAPTIKFNKQITAANIENGHLIFTFADGSEEDAGNLFNGNIVVEGNIAAVGVQATGTGVKTSVIQQNDASGIDVFASEVKFNNDLNAQGVITSENAIKTPALTSDENEISAQKPIIEVMEGYRFSCPSNAEGYLLTPRYAGICKNGNKLTLSLVLLVTRTSSTTNPYITDSIRFYIPRPIYEALVTQPIGGLSNLDNKLVYFIPSNSYTTHTAKTCLIGKKSLGEGNEYIYLNLYGLDLTIDTEYFVRIEETFLLSENLAA